MWKESLLFPEQDLATEKCGPVSDAERIAVHPDEAFPESDEAAEDPAP